MAIQVIRPLQRRSKPARWVFNPLFTSPEWRWFWDAAVAVYPLWESAGRVHNISRSVDHLTLANGAYWTCAQHGIALETGIDEACAQREDISQKLRLDWPVSIVWYGEWTGTPDHQSHTFGVFYDNWWTGAIWSYAFYVDGAGIFSLMWNSGGTYDYVTSSPNYDLDTAGNQKLILACGSIATGSQQLWIDGVPRGSTSDSLSSPTFDANATIAFGETMQVKNSQSRHYYGAVLNCALTASRVRQLWVDPFGPFRMTRRIAIPAAAGATGEIVESTLQDSFTLAEHAPRDLILTR